MAVEACAHMSELLEDSKVQMAAKTAAISSAFWNGLHLSASSPGVAALPGLFEWWLRQRGAPMRFCASVGALKREVGELRNNRKKHKNGQAVLDSDGGPD
jgi:hypothetical protein